MSHVAHEPGQGISGGSTRSGGVPKGDLGATVRKPGRSSWASLEKTSQGDRGGVTVPELAAFVGAKRSQLTLLSKAPVIEPLREALETVTRVASMRPQTFGRAQTLARLRARSVPAVPWGEPERKKEGTQGFAARASN